MSRDQRISQPKRNGEFSERRQSGLDNFLSQPQMQRSVHDNAQAINRTMDNGNYGSQIPIIAKNKSQDRFSANPPGTCLRFINQIIGDRNLKNDYDDSNVHNDTLNHNHASKTSRSGHARNNSASVDMNRLNASYKISKNLRPLPIYERENVYNEWGAVIKHQDEIDKELKKQQEQKFRERQRNYKLQLDQQYQELMQK